MKKNIMMSIMVLAGLTLTTPSYACKSPGRAELGGIVTAINLKNQTLTLKDAETGSRTVFKAPTKLLKKVKLNEQAIVSYEMFGHRLIAKRIDC